MRGKLGKVEQMGKTERRIFKRRRLDGKAWIFDPVDRRDNTCALVDISITGAAIDLPSNYALPKDFLIRLDKEEHVIECRQAWRSKTRIGVEFY
jgi:hypothetical protein